MGDCRGGLAERSSYSKTGRTRSRVSAQASCECRVFTISGLCLSSSCRIINATITGLFFLPETRPPHVHQSSDDETGQLKRPDTTYAATLKVPNFVLITGVFLSKRSRLIDPNAVADSRLPIRFVLPDPARRR